MFEYFFSIVLLITGVLIFVITYNDGKKRKMALTTSYIMHLQGYAGSIVIIIIGLMILYKS